MRLAELLQQPQALPTVPQVVHQLIDSLNHEDTPIGQVSRAIGADPVLSAKLLRLANSSYYHLSRTIGTVDDAVVMLGFMTVRTLVIGAGVAGSCPAPAGIDLGRFWRYSTQAAAVAAWIARRVQCSRDHAFLAGLMHPLGHLVMHAGMPEAMRQLDRQGDWLDADRAVRERVALGYDHAAVAAALLAHWKLPPVLVDAVAHCVDPMAAAPFEVLPAVVHLAAWRTRGHLKALNRDDLIACAPELVCAKLDISAEEILDEMPPMQELAEGLAAMVA